MKCPSGCNPGLQYMYGARPIARPPCSDVATCRWTGASGLSYVIVARFLHRIPWPTHLSNEVRQHQADATPHHLAAHASAESRYTCERFWSTNSYHPIHTFLEKMLELFPELYQETLRLFAAMACGEMAAGEASVQSTTFDAISCSISGACSALPLTPSSRCWHTLLCSDS